MGGKQIVNIEQVQKTDSFENTEFDRILRLKRLNGGLNDIPMCPVADRSESMAKVCTYVVV